MKAINLIKMQGGLAKSNPNRVKPDLEKKMSLKRRFEEEEEQEEGKRKRFRSLYSLWVVQNVYPEVENFVTLSF